MQEIAREVRASIAQRQGKSHLRDSATEKAKTRDAQHDRNNARARQNWCKWKIPLMQALQEKGEMTAKMIANLMGISMDAPAHKIYVAPQNARNIGIPLVVVRVDHIETSRGPRPRRWYGLSSSETLAPLTPPRDEQSNQFMKEVKEPGGNHHPIGTQLRGQYVAKIAHHGNLPWLEKVKEEFRLRGELCAADLRAVTGFRHQRIASYVASYIPLEIARREYEVLGTDSPQGVAKTTYYKMVEVH